MAKGNLFLGTAARSVGDVVMYRREGSQVSRVRVRKIANPKTKAQCRQRAYMAPIPKFFSPLAVVLERSFEGLSKAKSYAKFIKVNADKARANDWLLPKGIGFFPLTYQLSQGTLPSVLYIYTTEAPGINIQVGTLAETLTTVGQLSQAFVDAGYLNGDVVTIIGISNITGTQNYFPKTIQFEIDTASTAQIGTLTKTGLKIVSSATRIITVMDDLNSIVGGAVIVSRFENDKWRRSTQSLVVSALTLESIATSDYKAAAIESYSAAAGGANPLVYLDGDELDNA